MDELIIANPDGAQEVYILDVDRIAEHHRGQFITEGAGQAMTYLTKYQEAIDYKAGREGSFYHLKEEAAARELTLDDLVDEVILMRATWEKASAAIEGARARAKRRIRSSDSPQEWRQAIIDLETELPAPPVGQ